MPLRPLHRREFLQSTAAISAALWVGGAAAKESTSPNEKLNIAVIGPAGRGYDNLRGVASENIVAICEVDQHRPDVGKILEEFPKAKRYQDFRKLFDDQLSIDAVVVSTADHTHAPAASAAIRQGKHVYCEKPLTHTVFEARWLAEQAAAKKVATQMGTQIHAEENYRRVVEIIQSGAIGDVTEVDVWNGARYGGQDRPKETPAVPAGLDWDVWLGPAPVRPYHNAYVPFAWRGWWDFANGALGDLGCHYIDLVFWALKLRHPKTCEAKGPPVHPESTPTWLEVAWEFPARGTLPPVKLSWTDGDHVPSMVRGKQVPQAGILFVGTKGELFANYGEYRLYPEEKFAGFQPPPKSIPSSIGHHREWIQACKTGSPTTCNFDYSGALTETVLLGTVAYRVGKKLEWDAVNLKATNAPEAAQYISREYRTGWSL